MTAYQPIGCMQCGKTITPRSSREKHCSPECRFRCLVPASETGCWNWPLSLNKVNGYGQFNSGGRIVTAHAFSYRLFVGNVPSGLILRHTCDNAKCFNPKHLVPGTYSQNTQDMYERNRAGERWRSGQAHHNAKLTDAEVAAIRQSSLATSHLSFVYGVSESNIRQIRSGRSRVSTRQTSSTQASSR